MATTQQDADCDIKCEHCGKVIGFTFGCYGGEVKLRAHVCKPTGGITIVLSGELPRGEIRLTANGKTICVFHNESNGA